MSFARSSRPPLGLGGRLMLWTTAVLGISLCAGFAWVHHGLRAVLAAKNDAFLVRKGKELSAVLRDEVSGGREALEAEIRREVEAYRDEGLVVVIRRPSGLTVAPATAASRRLADHLARLETGPALRTLGAGPDLGLGRYRIWSIPLSLPGEPDVTLGLGLSLAETEATLAQFDRRVLAGGLVFLMAAAVGGQVLSRQALRPVANSIRTAQRLNPADLSARLPRTGSNDELDQLAGTINDLLDRLAAYHAQAARFTADASHELRSPLGAMRAAVDVALQRPRTADEYRDILGSVAEQCDRLTALVNGLLLLARADAGQVELERAPVDLASLADEVVELFQPVAEERGVSLSGRFDERMPVNGDGGRLRQLVTNLVDNAIKFTAPGGEVRVDCEQADGQVRLAVSDTGSGIPAGRLPFVFDRFYRADPARSSGGSGLGLSICRWITEAHGGAIRAESVEGRGSRFVVDLPAAGRQPAGRT